MDLEKLKQDIEASKQSEQEATEIIAELKHTLDCKNGTIETLKEENEKLIEDLGIANKYVNKYHQTLQEIKKYIAKICKEECGYVQKKRCPDCDCRFGAILDLITKAEEE